MGYRTIILSLPIRILSYEMISAKVLFNGKCAVSQLQVFYHIVYIFYSVIDIYIKYACKDIAAT